jgi:hypothetical protein
MDLAAYIIDAAKSKAPVDEVPCTKELSEVFECPYEFITSIGWAVRNDYKLPEDLEKYGQTEGEQKFNYFQRKYPTLDRFLTGNYELLPNYYGEQTFFVRKTLAYRSPVYIFLCYSPPFQICQTSRNTEVEPQANLKFYKP